MTSTCGTPHSATTSSTAASIDRRSVMSTSYVRTPSRHRRPRRCRSSRRASRAPRRPARYTCPSWPKPPVTTATATLEIEERIAHAAAARFAFQTASQNSRTQPCPPARVSTTLRERHHLGPRVRTARPAARRQRGTRRRSRRCRRTPSPRATRRAARARASRTGSLSSMPADALDADLPRASGNGVVRLGREDEVVDTDLVEPPEARPSLRGSRRRSPRRGRSSTRGCRRTRRRSRRRRGGSR